MFAFAGLTMAPADAQAPTWAQAGMLRCKLNPSIGFVIFGHQSMECSFQPVSGPVQGYEGAINTVGLDVPYPSPLSSRAMASMPFLARN